MTIVKKSIIWHKAKESGLERPLDDWLPCLVKVDFMMTVYPHMPQVETCEYMVAYEVDETGAMYDYSGDHLGWSWQDVSWVASLPVPIDGDTVDGDRRLLEVCDDVHRAIDMLYHHGASAVHVEECIQILRHAVAHYDGNDIDDAGAP
jgi:hypothetical protein